MTRFRCSGEAAAFDAGRHDQCECADCHRFFPGGDLWIFPHGEVCDECKENREDKGLNAEAFGTSPRQPKQP